MDLAEHTLPLRRANGLSARQLVALVDVAPTTITRIESGAVSPSFDLAQEILTVLGEPIGFTGLADVDAIASDFSMLMAGWPPGRKRTCCSVPAMPLD